MRWLCNSTATGSKKKKIKSRTSDDIVEEASKGPVGRPTKKAKKKKASVSTIFQHADGIDLLLMAMGFLGAVGDGLCTPVMFLIMSRLMNNLGHGPSGLPSSFLQNINQNAADFLFLACCSWVVSFLEGYCWTRTGERQAARTRASYLKAVLRQDVGYFDMRGADTSEVVTSVSNDTLIIQDALGEKVPNLIMNAATLVGSYCTAFLLEWRLAVVAFPFAALLIIPGLMYGRMLMSLARKMRQEYNKAGAVAEQAISSVRTVYSSAAEAKTMSEYSAALQGTARLGLRQGLAKGLAVGSNGITFAIWAFMSWYGSRLVMYQGGQGGTVFAAGASITLGGLALGSGLSNVKCLAEACSAGERIMEVINMVPKIDSDDVNGETMEEVTGEVEFRNLKFSYPSRPDHPVLWEFNLKVPAGKTVALVGKSGSGKSTAIALLERFYDPTGGEILLDGVNIRKLQLKWLRAQMGLVSQEPALFATTIKENILFGKEEADMDEVVAAAKAANAHHFISHLPQGYDTQVGERGLQMSGGQKQRIAIARAVLRCPKILLLDEATSALDSESERTVQEALHKAAAGRTTVVVAHRLSTIRHADLIAVVHNGQVAECGSLDRLILNPLGLYASLAVAGIPSDNHRQSVDIGRSSTSLPTAPTNSAGEDSKLHSTSITKLPTHINNDNDHQPYPAVSFWRLLSLNLPEWKHASVGFLAATSFGAVQPVYAYTMGSMVSAYFLADHEEIKTKTRSYTILFFLLFLASFAVNVVQHYNFGAMGEYLTKRVRERMLSKMLTFEVGWFDRRENSTGALCSRLAKDANVVRSLVGDRMALLLQTFSAVAIACTMGLIIAWRLALVMIAVQPLIIVCFYARKVLLRDMSTKSVRAQEESSKLAAEAVSHLRTVTAFSSQARILRMFDAVQDGPRRQSVRQSWLAGVGLGSSQCLSTCSWALDFWYGGKLVAGGFITAKAMLQTFMILVSTGRVIADAGSMTSDLAKGSDSVATVFAVLDRYTRIKPDDPEGHRPDKIVGQVKFVDVDFAYPARPGSMVLESFSLEIEAGKSTALVGPSGSGKSTLIGLIERFYDPVRGAVKIDGLDLGSYHLRSLRKHIALVGQEPTLFSGTIKYNIAYGSGHESDDMTESEIVEAARTAGAHEFIAGLKRGYDTWCGEGGAQLSGGQKQRIAIARAILRSPAILLLDEATSALDSQSEQVVQEALERVSVGRTTVVVAHRLSTIKKCDLIVVLQSGAVVEKGTHTTLMAKGPSGSYFSLVALQQQPNADIAKSG